MAVFEKVQEIIVEELGKRAIRSYSWVNFDDLEADSLDLFQVISEIDAFDIKLKLKKVWNTVGDLVACVKKN